MEILDKDRLKRIREYLDSAMDEIGQVSVYNTVRNAVEEIDELLKKKN